MNIRLTPQSEQILREQLTHGNFRSPEEVIERALQALVDQKALGSPRLSPPDQSPEQFAAFLDALAAYSDEIPPMPGETFSREMIYQKAARQPTPNPRA